MQVILFTLFGPVLPLALWKCYSKEKKAGKREVVLRYFTYMAIEIFISTILLSLFSNENTSFWVKMDKSAEFAFKYAVMELGAALLTALAEWSFLKKRSVLLSVWEKLESCGPVVFFKKYICPVLPYVLAVLIICLNMSLMFDNVLWGDEAFSANTVGGSLYGILQVMYYWDNHPPLYYYWLKLFGELFGYTVPVYHLASLVPFAAGILLALFPFRKRYGTVPAVFFMVISGLGAACLEYNLEVRMYALAFFCITACFYCSCRVIDGGKKKAWIAMVFWGVAGAYTHYYALVTGGLIVFFTGAAVWVRERGRSWLKGAGAVFAFLLGYSPWLSFLFLAVHKVSQNWWVSEVLGLDSVLDIVMGGTGMAKIITPLLTVLSAFVLLTDSGILSITKREDTFSAEIHKPDMKKWENETFSIAVGLFTIVGTIAFAYFLCFVMTPVLVDRYLYPLSAVSFCLLILCSSRVLKLLRRLERKAVLPHLESFGRAVLVCLTGVLLVIGMGNYQRYSVSVRQQSKKTDKTLAIIGIPEKDVKMVSNGVKHLGWTVLHHYYLDNEVVNGDYNMAEGDRFWYFSPDELSQETLNELERGGVSVKVYGENQIAVYPFYLYYFEKKS